MKFEQGTIKRKTNRLWKPARRFKKKCSFQIEMEEVNSKMDPAANRFDGAEVNFYITKLREKRQRDKKNGRIYKKHGQETCLICKH